MKGLLLKDLYMMRKYCRAYLIITAVFVALSLANDESLFLTFYPCMVCSMIPVNLLGYDEQSHWLQYSGTLPYTKGQIVSCKYLIGLMVQIAILIVIGVSQAVRMNISGTFNLNDYIVLLLMMLIVSTVISSIGLPFMFKLGVEKGRIAYIIVGSLFAVGSIAVIALGADLNENIDLSRIIPFISLGAIAIYALSWYLSVVFYKKREL